MIKALKHYCCQFCNGYIGLTEEPSPATSASTFGRRVAVVCYVLCLVAAVYVTSNVIVFAQHIQSVTDSDLVLLPDIIFCPRPGFAAVILSNAPSVNETEANAGMYRERYVRWMDDSGWVQRLARHEHYANNVWYNLQVLDVLNMTETDVDRLTGQVKADPELRSRLAPELRPFLSRLSKMAAASFAHDLEVLESNNEFDNQLGWQLPIHPRLQEQLATNLTDSNELRLFWWAVIKTQYVMEYSQSDNQTNYVKNRRFNCYGVEDCKRGFSALWLDNSYCIMWGSLSTNFLALYQPDLFDDIQMWTGNAAIQNIQWSDFMTPSLEYKTGWFQTSLERQKVQGVYQSLRALRIQPVAGKGKERAVCQTMIDKPQNELGVRARFCNFSNRPLKDYFLYTQVKKLSKSYHYVIRADAMKAKLFTDKPQFSLWQLISLVGGTFGLICGLSALQILQMLVIRTRRKLIIQLLIGTVLLGFATFYTVSDVTTALNPETRYVLSPFMIDSKRVPIPTISVRGYTYFSQLTLNHTRLAEYQVSPQLLRYLCIAATGQICGSDNKIHGTDPFKQRERLLKFWDHPYEQLFVTIRPNSSFLSTIEAEYSSLARSLNLDGNTAPAYNVFKHFLLDPCAIVLECQLDLNVPWKCCSEFTWRPHYEELMIYNLYWSNPTSLTFSNGSLAVFFDTDQYLEHSDGLAPYLGPNISVQEAISTDGVQWKNNNHVILSFESNEGGDSTAATEFSGSISSKVTNGRQYQVVFRAKPDKLLTQAEYPESTCVADPKCKFSRIENMFLRYRAIERLCPCQLKYSETFMIDLKSKKPFCIAHEAIRCFLDDKFFSGYCHHRPDLGDFKVPAFDWDSNDTENYEKVHPNIFFYAYQWNYACGWRELWMDEKSPLGTTITRTDRDSCTNSRPCLRFQYNTVAGVSKFSDASHDRSKGFKLIVSIYESAEPGTEQRDTFDLPAIVGLSLNSFGLFFGLSLITIMYIVRISIEKCFTPAKDKDLVETVQNHLKRSMGFVKAANAMRIAPEQSGTLGNQEQEKDAAESVDLPSLSHILMAIVSILGVVILILIFVQIVPKIYNDSLSSYTVRFNETNVEPALALCITSKSTDDIDEQLMNLTKCSYRGEGLPCDNLFPLLWRPSYAEVNGVSACVVTNQLLQMSARTLKIDLRESIYKVNTLQHTIFSHVWIGELSTLYATSASKPMLFNKLSANSQQSRLSFTMKKNRKYSDCEMKSFPDMISCADVLESNADHQLCLQSMNSTDDLPKVVDGCVSIEYESQMDSETGGLITLEKDTTDQSLQVVFAEYVWLDITQRPMYNWAQQLIIFGGYFDQIIGISVLNVTFVVVWVFGRRTFLKIKELFGKRV